MTENSLVDSGGGGGIGKWLTFWHTTVEGKMILRRIRKFCEQLNEEEGQ